MLKRVASCRFHATQALALTTAGAVQAFSDRTEMDRTQPPGTLSRRVREHDLRHSVVAGDEPARVISVGREARFGKPGY